MKKLILLSLLIVGCAVITKNNVNINEIIIGVWEAGHVSRPELPKDIWTISKDKIIAESFEPYSHQFDNKSLIDSAIYILKDNTISITYPDGTVPYVINIIDSNTILLGNENYGLLLNRKQTN
mgnify:CR=1 FL=1